MKVTVSLLLAAILAAVPACSSSGGDSVKEVAVNVLTLQSGAVEGLREMRGNGPFRDYAVPPREMLELVADVLSSKVVAVFPNPRAGEVVAKERKADVSQDDWYGPAWVSAVVVIVHPVAADARTSRVEIHATNRGPFHRGKIAWEAELPALLDRRVAERGKPTIRPLR